MMDHVIFQKYRLSFYIRCSLIYLKTFFLRMHVASEKNIIFLHFYLQENIIRNNSSMEYTQNYEQITRNLIKFQNFHTTLLSNGILYENIFNELRVIRLYVHNHNSLGIFHGRILSDNCVLVNKNIKNKNYFVIQQVC